MAARFQGTGPIPVMVVGWILIFIAAGLIIARLYLRLGIQRTKILISDIMMLLAWCLACSYLILNAVLWKLGALGATVGSLLVGLQATPERIENIFKMFWVCNIPLYMTFYLCKGALLSMYLDIFPDFMIKRRIFLWVITTYVSLAFIASILVVVLICQPIQTNWDLSPSTTCPPIKNQIVFKTLWALHFFGDCLVFIPPWLIIGKLNVRRTLKVGIYATSLLGLITLTFSVLRYTLIMDSEVEAVIPVSTAMLWGIIESELGLIITCIPSLRPYFHQRSEGPPTNRFQRKFSKATETMRTIGSGDPQKKRSSTMSSTEELGAEKARNNSSETQLVSPRASEVPSKAPPEEVV